MAETQAGPGRRRRGSVRAAALGALVAGALLSGCGAARPTALPPTTAPPFSGLAATSLPQGFGGLTTAAGSGTAPPTTSVPVTSGGSVSSTTAPPATTTTTAPGPLGPGSSGPAVLALQQRLTSLGYWLGTPDGRFGDATEQAVYALQKAAGISRDGLVGPQTAAALASGAVPAPRPANGYVIEIDLADDLLMFVTNGRLEWTLNTSTGGGYAYTGTSVAVTPDGVYSIFREVDGMVTDNLGQLWRPKFFVGGIAIHGDSYVPPVPVSHGCVRVSNEAIDWIWTHGMASIGATVWVYT